MPFRTPRVLWLPGSVKTSPFCSMRRGLQKHWGPRVGFAYSPGSNGTTSIRGRLRLAYDVFNDTSDSRRASTDRAPRVTSTPQRPKRRAFWQAGAAEADRGLRFLMRRRAVPSTSNWIPPDVKQPYSSTGISGVQHSFCQGLHAEFVMSEPAASIWMSKTESPQGVGF